MIAVGEVAGAGLLAHVPTIMLPYEERLLENDRDTLRLLRRSPFPADAPPRYVRARLFRYRYTTWHELRGTGACWHRTHVRDFLPPTRLEGTAGRRVPHR